MRLEVRDGGEGLPDDAGVPRVAVRAHGVSVGDEVRVRFQDFPRLEEAEIRQLADDLPGERLIRKPLDRVAGEARRLHDERGLVLRRHRRGPVLRLGDPADAEGRVGNVDRRAAGHARPVEPEEQQADVSEAQPGRRLPGRFRQGVAEEADQERQRESGHDAVLDLPGPTPGEADPPHLAAVALQALDLEAGVDRFRGERAGEGIGDAAITAARIQEAAVDVLGLAAREDQLVQQRPQRHSLQPAGRDVGRELIGRKSPELGGIVEEDPPREGLAETPDGEILEADRRRPPPPSRAQEIQADAAGLAKSVREHDVQGRRRKVDEAPAVEDRAGRLDANELLAHQLDDVPRDLRVPIVKAVGSAIVEMVAVAQRPAHPAEIRRALVELERKAGPIRVERDSQARRPPSQDREVRHASPSRLLKNGCGCRVRALCSRGARSTVVTVESHSSVSRAAPAKCRPPFGLRRRGRRSDGVIAPRRCPRIAVVALPCI